MESAKLHLNTPGETAMELGARIKALRLEREWKRETLAKRSGVSIASLRRFESTGQASLELVLKVAHALSRHDEFDAMFQPTLAKSIHDLEQHTATAARKRGSR